MFPRDEDLISPHIMFAGMPTWDSVMALCRLRSVCGLSGTPRSAGRWSAEAVEGTVAQAAPGTVDRRGSPTGILQPAPRDLVEVSHGRTCRSGTGKFDWSSCVEQLAQEQGKGDYGKPFWILSLDEDLETALPVTLTGT